MKTISFTLVVICIGCAAMSQTAREGLQRIDQMGRERVAADSAYREQMAQKAATEASAKAEFEASIREGYERWTRELFLLTSNPAMYFRLVDGVTNDILELEYIHGKVTQVVDQGILVTRMTDYYPPRYDGQTVLLVDWDGLVADDDVISFRAKRIGTVKDIGKRTYAKYKCGSAVFPSPEMVEIRRARIIASLAPYEDKLKAEAAQIEAAKAKKIASASAALKANQDAATKGDAYGLLRMGQRYRDGDGVEKDLVKAREYFEKAVQAGSLTAAEELAKLQISLSNSK